VRLLLGRELFDELEAAGFTLRTEGDKLIVSPADKLTEALTASIRELKADLLAELLHRQDTPVTRAIKCGWSGPFDGREGSWVCLSWPDDTFTVALPTSVVEGIDAARKAAEAKLAKRLHFKGGCLHPRLKWYRIGPHVAELCQDCGANFRGAGHWVTKEELQANGLSAAVLPPSPWKTQVAEPEADLFGATS
jgi:hypothetical protein